MSNIVCCYAILSADNQNNKVYIASSEKNKIKLPFSKIETPKFLYNEIRLYIKNLFANDAIKFYEEIIISFMDIQNYLLMNIVTNEKELYNFDTDSDIVLLCGIILHQKLPSNQFYWVELDKPSAPDFLQTMTDHSRLVQYILDKMII